MGRKAKPIKERKTQLYSYRNDDDELEHRLQMMAKREGITVGALRVQAIIEYDDRHWKGNYQTLMESFEQDGDKSDGQFEQGIMNYFAKQERDISGREIWALVKDSEIIPQKREASVDRIANSLTMMGKKVWRS